MGLSPLGPDAHRPLTFPLSPLKLSPSPFNKVQISARVKFLKPSASKKKEHRKVCVCRQSFTITPDVS
jgi:hypothetical protein